MRPGPDSYEPPSDEPDVISNLGLGFFVRWLKRQYFRGQYLNK
jgi:hypothetical protein